MRLIDADAIIKDLEWQMDTHNPNWTWDNSVACYDLIEYLNKIPTIEPKRGEWVSEKCNHKPYRITNPEKWVIYKCSICGYSNGRKQSNYCPSCGADMRGEVNA